MALDDLYREVIMDHYKRPRNRGTLDDADVVVEGANPLCGDEVTLWLDISGGKIQDVRFAGHGCSISQASASIMTEAIEGRPIGEIIEIVQALRGMMLEGEEPDEALLGDGVALEGVRQFPVRIKCAVLGWNTLRLGLQQFADSDGKPVEAHHRE